MNDAATTYTEKDFSRFLVILVVTIIVVLGARYGFVVIEDPWGRFNFNADKLSIFRERESKPWLVGIYPHNAILIGTSKSANINAADLDTHELRFFNASFSGARPEEMYSFIGGFVTDTKLLVL